MRYKIIDQKGLNFITLTIVDWIDLFTRRWFCELVLESLDYSRKEKGLLIFAYVYNAESFAFDRESWKRKETINHFERIQILHSKTNSR